MTAPLCAIITPSLAIEPTAAMLQQARDTAGCAVCTVLVQDGARRGSTIPGNAAMAAALALGMPYICYVNDDVRFTQQGWLARLIEALQTNERYGIAVPSGPCRTRPQCTGGPGMPPGVQIVAEVSLFCGVMRRAVAVQVQPFFDPAYVHYANDSDFRVRVQRAGWDCVWVRDVYVEHDLAEYIGEWKERDRETFRKRWGK